MVSTSAYVCGPARRERPLSRAELNQIRALGEGRTRDFYCRWMSEHGAAPQVFRSLVRRGLVVAADLDQLTDAGLAVYRERWGLPPVLLAARRAAYLLGGLPAMLALLSEAERADWLSRALGRAELISGKKCRFSELDYAVALRGILIEEEVLLASTPHEPSHADVVAVLHAQSDVEATAAFYRRKAAVDG